MKNDFYYRIAGFDIKISTFRNLCIDSVLPSFIPFKLLNRMEIYSMKQKMKWELSVCMNTTPGICWL